MSTSIFVINTQATKGENGVCCANAMMNFYINTLQYSSQSSTPFIFVMLIMLIFGTLLVATITCDTQFPLVVNISTFSNHRCHNIKHNSSFIQKSKQYHTPLHQPRYTSPIIPSCWPYCHAGRIVMLMKKMSTNQQMSLGNQCRFLEKEGILH